MKPSYIAILMFSIIFAGCSNSEPQPSITVGGEATVKMPVEYVKFSVQLTKRGSELKPLTEKSYQIMLQIKEVLLEKWNIADSLVHTENNFIRRVYNRDTSDDSYRFSQRMVVTLDSVALYETLRRDLIEAGANEFELMYFGNFNKSKYKKEAFQKAYQNALQKAKLLAKSATLEVIKPQKITSRVSINLDADFDLNTKLSPPGSIQILESTIIKKI